MPRRPHPTAPTVLAALALAGVACGGDGDLQPSPVDDTSATTSSEEISESADDAATGDVADAEADPPSSVTFDGTALPVAGVTCSEGPEVTAALEDGGDLTVTSDADGTVEVRIVVPADDGASAAWAVTDPPTSEVAFPPDGAEGEVTLAPVDDAGQDETGSDRDEAEVVFTLACDPA